MCLSGLPPVAGKVCLIQLQPLLRPPHCDEEEFKEYRLEGSYNDMNYRQSFTIDINKCNPKINKNCAPEADLLKFYETFIWTFYVIEGAVEFKEENLMKSPIVTKRKFHSQFKLDSDVYKD